MEPGDITTYTDHFGKRHACVIVEKLEDGRYSLSVFKPSHLAVEASAAQGDKGFVFDPTMPAPAPEPAEEPVEGETESAQATE